MQMFMLATSWNGKEKIYQSKYRFIVLKWEIRKNTWVFNKASEKRVTKHRCCLSDSQKHLIPKKIGFKTQYLKEKKTVGSFCNDICLLNSVLITLLSLKCLNWFLNNAKDN